MTLYEKWLIQAYTKDGDSIPAYWNIFMPQEQKIYEEILESKNPVIEGTVSDLAEKYSMKPEQIVGFLDGINEALTTSVDVNELEADSVINATIDFKVLYQKMVEYKADHLFSLPQWNDIFTTEERMKLYKEQKTSRTIVKEAKVGRNDPCPCGSGKKYKKCCGSNAN